MISTGKSHRARNLCKKRERERREDPFQRQKFPAVHLITFDAQNEWACVRETNLHRVARVKSSPILLVIDYYSSIPLTHDECCSRVIFAQEARRRRARQWLVKGINDLSLTDPRQGTFDLWYQRVRLRNRGSLRAESIIRVTNLSRDSFQHLMPASVRHTAEAFLHSPRKYILSSLSLSLCLDFYTSIGDNLLKTCPICKTARKTGKGFCNLPWTLWNFHFVVLKFKRAKNLLFRLYRKLLFGFSIAR